MKKLDLNYEAIADKALNIAVKHIQDSIGEKTGDYASQWFTGIDQLSYGQSYEEMILTIFAMYAKDNHEWITE